ncbi:MAG: hypothetical protein IJZ28_04915 [Clostridia bacterium]|nr:hypothetical protein [Clostridia bacterium]
MMTKKTMTIVSVFMIVALTAVGFAAWLITGTIDYKAEGSFVANELDDKYFKVEVAFDEHIVDKDETDVDESRNNGKVIFGRPDEDEFSANDAWLSYSVNDEEEKLTVIATVKFIPDGGFSRNITGQADKDMKYYLYEAKESGSVSDPTITEKYRTIRVKIDINEFFETNTVDGVTTTEQKTMNHQWFDWAVQLGYLQYPTAHVVETNEDGTATHEDYTDFTKANEDYQFKWASAADTKEKAAFVALPETIGSGEDAISTNQAKFEYGYLCFDLTYDMFDIQYADADAKTATVATAKVVINFNWGEAFKFEDTSKTPSVVSYLNPYEFFYKEAHKPENEIDIFEKLGVKQYLITTPGAQYNTYSLDNLTIAEADANND